MHLSSPSDLVIDAHALEYTYSDGTKAVRGVDLQVARGEIFGFLGPNGAGKSTTVRMLTTLLRPTGGSATVAGFDVAREPGRVRKCIGVALQEAGLNGMSSGFELLEMHARLHGMSRAHARSRAHELLEIVQLTDAADRRAVRYSGGMKRRLDLAIALVHRPRVLFLDEPTTGLDPTSRFVIWDQVRRLRTEEGTTVLLTTQYLDEADQLADRIAIIDDGVIVSEGTPEALKREVGADIVRVELAGGRMTDSSDNSISPGRERTDVVMAAALSVAGTASAAIIDNELIVRTSDGAVLAAPLLAALSAADVRVARVQVEQPTLDDVFLAVTNAAPRTRAEREQLEEQSHA
ncbi:MAG: ATP-binding cassette domain-containing protein [Thermoleophilia bacterium]|nr:ATP-binding cassette domain-containing protein [Thermoleophilia bacterium]